MLTELIKELLEKEGKTLVENWRKGLIAITSALPLDRFNLSFQTYQWADLATRRNYKELPCGWLLTLRRTSTALMW